jgi:hypothetical protein
LPYKLQKIHQGKLQVEKLSCVLLILETDLAFGMIFSFASRQGDTPGGCILPQTILLHPAMQK